MKNQFYPALLFGAMKETKCGLKYFYEFQFEAGPHCFGPRQMRAHILLSFDFAGLSKPPKSFIKHCQHIRQKP